MFYFFYSCLKPNTASANRCLSFLRGFDELGVETTFVVLIPDVNHHRLENNYRHIKIVYLWKDWPIAQRLFDRLSRPIAMKRFLSIIKAGDSVFCYGSPAYVSLFVEKEGVHVFHERTESPEVIPLPSKRLQERYIESCKSLEGLFVISTALKDFFVKKGVDPNIIHIINMTVDSNRFVGLRKNKVNRYVAYCGTASNNKDGVDDLIKAFALFVQKYPDVKLYIVGKAPTSTDDEADNIKLIHELGVRESVVFTGEVSASQIPQILKDSTILALCRPDSIQARNGFPTKLGEYLLTENPVVVTSVGDIPCFLKDGESALLAEQRNIEEFASKLCWVLDNPEEAAIIGRRGKEVAMREFNYLTESKKIIEFIYGNNTCSR